MFLCLVFMGRCNQRYYQPTINPSNCDDFEKCNNQKWQTSSLIIHEIKPPHATLTTQKKILSYLIFNKFFTLNFAKLKATFLPSIKFQCFEMKAELYDDSSWLQYLHNTRESQKEHGHAQNCNKTWFSPLGLS